MEFENAKKLLSEGETLRALSIFEREYFRQPQNPEFQSYFGLAVALERGQITRSLALCTEALEQDPDRADFHLNLARVHLKAGNKEGAVRLLRAGRRLDPENREIFQLLSQLGFRARPLIPILPRGHFVNRLFGLLAHRVGLRRPSRITENR